MPDQRGSGQARRRLVVRRAHPGDRSASPGLAVTVILGFLFCWNAFNYPLMLAGRQTFPVTVGAIQFISYEQVLWGQMAAATIVAALRQLVLSLMVQKYIVR